LSQANRKLFGTDGVRGVANVEPITSETALKLGRALACVFRGGTGRHHRILIGKDTRLSGYMLETAMESGICSMGVDVWLVGPLPTPGIAFLTRSMRADAGVVISASHNSFEDNGIKFFSREGFKLDDETERRIEELVFDEGKLVHLRAKAGEIGKFTSFYVRRRGLPARSYRLGQISWGGTRSPPQGGAPAPARTASMPSPRPWGDTRWSRTTRRDCGHASSVRRAHRPDASPRRRDIALGTVRCIHGHSLQRIVHRIVSV